MNKFQGFVRLLRIILLLLKVFWKKAIYKIIQPDEFIATLLRVPNDLSRKTPAIITFGRDLQKSTKKAKKILWIKDIMNLKKKNTSVVYSEITLNKFDIEDFIKVIKSHENRGNLLKVSAGKIKS